MTFDSQAHLRSWLSWVPLLALAVAGIIGYRMWTDRLEQSPVAEVHAGFLNFMAEHSPRAQEYRHLYYRKFGRESVASKHFEQVCAAMLNSAIADGAQPAKYSEPMTKGCQSFARKYPLGALPEER